MCDLTSLNICTEVTIWTCEELLVSRSEGRNREARKRLIWSAWSGEMEGTEKRENRKCCVRREHLSVLSTFCSFRRCNVRFSSRLISYGVKMVSVVPDITSSLQLYTNTRIQEGIWLSY